MDAKSVQKDTLNSIDTTIQISKILKEDKKREHSGKNNAMYFNNEDEPNMQISSITVSDPTNICTCCDNVTCNSCLHFWLAKTNEILIGLAIS